MTTLKLSDITGLPVLPENHFWRVTDHAKDPEHYRFSQQIVGYEHPTGVSVNIMERVLSTEVRPKQCVWMGISFEWGTEEVPSEMIRCVATRYIKDYSVERKPVFTRSEDLDAAIKKALLAVQNDEIKVRTLDHKYRQLFMTDAPEVLAADLTPELLLEAAEKCLENHNARILAQSLIGDYPPKTLILDGGENVD